MNVLLDTLKGKVLNQKPIWLMRQAGRYLPEYLAIRAQFPDFMTFCFTPNAVQEVTLQPIRRFDFDGAIIFSDILVIPHLLGQNVTFQKDHGPILDPMPLEALVEITTKNSLGDNLTPIANAIKETRRALPATKALLGFAGAPWTLATYMLSHGKTKDFSTLMHFCEANLALVQSLINGLCQQVITLLDGHITAGCDAVQIFDTWAGEVPLAHQNMWIIKPPTTIVQALRSKHPHIPIIYYARGASHLYETLGDLNLAFSVDEFTPLDSLNLRAQTVLQGNLCPQKLAAGEFEVDALGLKQALPGRPHIINLGHGILPHTPIEHVEQLVEIIRSN
jgi:uroporphyrinogen decarboxylase